VLDDARTLIHQEIALARAELRSEISTAKSLGLLFAASAVLAIVGLVLLCVSVGNAAAQLLEVPEWSAYGVIAILLAAAAYVLMSRGQRQLATIQVLPKTKESIRENVAWIQNKSNSR